MKSRWIWLIGILLALVGGALGGIVYETIRERAPNGLFKWHPVVEITVDGQRLPLQPPAVIIDDRVYVPLDSLSQVVCSGVQGIRWDGGGYVAAVTTYQGSSTPTPGIVNGVGLKAAYDTEFSKETVRLWALVEQEIKNDSRWWVRKFALPVLQEYKSRYDAEMDSFRRNLWNMLASGR